MRRSCRPVLVAVLVVASASPLPAEDAGRIVGGILAPDGSAARGCRVTVSEPDGERSYRSADTGVDGRFEIVVPAGTRYHATAITLPDGRVVAVRDSPGLTPRPDRPARIDLQVVASAPAASGSGRPWYATTAVLIGIAAGVAALIVIARDDTQIDVSPSEPES